MTAGTLLVYGVGSPLGRRMLQMLGSGAQIRAVAADSLAPDALRAAVRDAQVVVNAAMGAPQVILGAAERLAEAMRGGPAERPLVHVSSMSVYGEATGVCDIASPAVGTLSAYAAAHVAAEAIARSFPQTVVLRPGVEYGPGCEAWSGRIARWLEARRIGDLGAGGDGYCNLVFIDDLVRTVLATAQAPASAGRIFNVAMRDPPTWNGYLIAYGVALGAIPVRRMARRRRAIETKLLAPPLKVAELTLGRVPFIGRQLPPAIPPSFLRLCAQEIRLDVRATEEALGLAWTPIAEGLRAAAASYRSKPLRG
jgi:2-alkyl-3-oxoalkanoate reductase